jgi:hypothetical protein
VTTQSYVQRQTLRGSLLEFLFTRRRDRWELDEQTEEIRMRLNSEEASEKREERREKREERREKREE